MKYHILILLLAIAVSGAYQNAEAQQRDTMSPAQGNSAITQPLSPSEELLLDVIFYGDVLDGDENRAKVSALDVNAFPEEIRARVAEFKYRYLQFKSMLKEPEYGSNVSASFMAEIVHKKRVSLEHSIVAMINTPGIEERAADYASDAVFYYEWEGLSEGPMFEGAQANNYLYYNPRTPLEPYLILFVIHRDYSAIQALKREHVNFNSPETMKWLQESEEHYARFMRSAAKHPDPLVGWMAKAIARLRN